MAKFTHDLTLPTLFSFAELTLFGLKTFKKQEAPRLALNLIHVKISITGFLKFLENIEMEHLRKVGYSQITCLAYRRNSNRF